MRGCATVQETTHAVKVQRCPLALLITIIDETTVGHVVAPRANL